MEPHTTSPVLPVPSQVTSAPDGHNAGNGSLLFIAPIGIGNVILLIPTLRACKQALPGSRLAVVVANCPSQEILKACPYVDEVVLLPHPNRKHAGRVLDGLRRIRKLRKKHYDISITAFPCNHAFYNLLAFAVGAPVRIAHRYHVRQRHSLSLLQNVQVPMKRVHDVEQNLELLQPLVPEFGSRRLSLELLLELWIPGKARADAEQFLRPYLQESGRLIGLHAGSSTAHKMSHKRWPAERFTQLAQQLLESYPHATLFLFGGREETQLNQTIAAQLGPTPGIFYSDSILHTAAAIERMSVFISNDSGLMHIAAAVGVPTIAIFGPTDPLRTSPYSRNHVVVRSGLDCSPCWALEEVGVRKACRYATRRCLAELPVSVVAQKVISYVAQSDSF